MQRSGHNGHFELLAKSVRNPLLFHQESQQSYRLITFPVVRNGDTRLLFRDIFPRYTSDAFGAAHDLNLTAEVGGVVHIDLVTQQILPRVLLENL